MKQNIFIYSGKAKYLSSIFTGKNLQEGLDKKEIKRILIDFIHFK